MKIYGYPELTGNFYPDGSLNGLCIATADAAIDFLLANGEDPEP